MKVCTDCHNLKDMANFYKDSRHLDGKASRCKECHKKVCNKWRKANPEKANRYCSESRKRNPGKVRFDRAMRHATKMQATPKWLTKQQREEIKRIYSNCPKGFEVDHEIPLRGKTVRGLHVPWNLRYLNRSENRRKSNKL